jgi:DNA-binding CsgD family transcriptional regulator
VAALRVPAPGVSSSDGPGVLMLDARGRVVKYMTSAERWLRLHAALFEADVGSMGNTVPVIEPVGPHKLAWLRTAAYGLTAREREVVELVLRGTSTKQIAMTLCIAEFTVKEHLSHIYDKVDARSARSSAASTWTASIPHHMHVVNSDRCHCPRSRVGACEHANLECFLPSAVSVAASACCCMSGTTRLLMSNVTPILI